MSQVYSWKWDILSFSCLNYFHFKDGEAPNDLNVVLPCVLSVTVWWARVWEPGCCREVWKRGSYCATCKWSESTSSPNILTQRWQTPLNSFRVEITHFYTSHLPQQCSSFWTDPVAVGIRILHRMHFDASSFFSFGKDTFWLVWLLNTFCNVQLI